MEKTKISIETLKNTTYSLTITQTLLVAQTDLAGIVDLCTQRSILVQIVLGTDTELRVIARRRPGQLDTGL